MQPEHKRYATRRFAKCQCDRPSFRAWGDPPHIVTHDPALVTFECAECGDLVAVFYRLPEMEEQQKAKADTSLVGQPIRADRRIAWVGYAKNPATLALSEKDVEEEARLLVIRGMLKTRFGQEVITAEDARRFLDNIDQRVASAFIQQARYNLRGRRYHNEPLQVRGLWFQDVSVEGVLSSIVPCLTGERKPGRGDECNWEGPYLSNAKHHRLYGVVTTEGKRVLVHPSDIQEK